ncbi:MAG: glycoside hydrolase family 3 C-terminal domain-containing protein [Fimbriimonadaceae bacterium]|nr:glycoside hydrolase family 3 C-terminal domain-containing protein [Fimbriimonadaceae bacterium]
MLAAFCLAVTLVHPQQTIPPYKNFRIDPEIRAKDLVSRMTLQEKVSQMTHGAAGIPRLDVAPYNWWNECLHGVARAGVATVFPQSIGLGATWNEDLMFKIADATSTEARAKHHDAARKGDFGIYKGLTFWSPNINIFRDPRWGRGQETYGEDPFLTARLGVQFVKGLQGNDPTYFKVIATPKHYAVHSGPDPMRHEFDAKATMQDMWATYLPHFEATMVEAGAWSIMGAYNRINGYPANAHPYLLEQVLRKDWNFNGYVVSDCWAINDFWGGHKFSHDKVAAVAMAVKMGCDLECGEAYPALVEAVKKGLITEAEIDRSVRRLMEARIRLGMFDPPERVQYTQIPMTVVNNTAHQKLALDAARESLVLLKNARQTLPFDSKKVRKLALIGPNADNIDALVGNYHGTPRDPITPLRGLREYCKSKGIAFAYEQACGLTSAPSNPIPADSLLDATAARGGLTAEYFSNDKLEGEPTHKTEEAVNFNWARNAPKPGVPADNFSVRWTGYLYPEETGEYEIGFTHDDGVRVWVDGKLIIDNWRDDAARRSSAKVKLADGSPVPIKIEYYDHGLEAVAILDWVTPDSNPFDKSIAAAKNADVVVLALGISPRIEEEELDRLDIGLPAIQQRLMKEIVKLGKPTVLVLLNGGPITDLWAHQNVPAILEAWYPGESGGRAIAEAIFGEYNPGGRLPVTVYRSLSQLPSYESYAMQGRTYRYFAQDPLYKFGHGLSYTSFRYDRLRVTNAKDGGLEVRVRVTNTGKRAGDEVVQVYLAHEKAPFPKPIRELKAFDRIRLDAGKSQEVVLKVRKRDVGLIDLSGKNVRIPGMLQVWVGGRQPEKADKIAANSGVVVGVRYTIK